MKHLIVISLALNLLATGCEKVSHSSIDKWERTEKGPDKLKKALVGDHSAELRAHAAQVLIRISEQDAVAAALEKARDADKIMAELEPRLWKDAEVVGTELARPSGLQIRSKDALFDLRKFAAAETLTQLDAHLVEWLTSGYYEGRARTGRHSGRRIVRELGPGAGPALLTSALGLLAKPQNPDGSWARVGDELLAGLAFSGHPKGLGLLLDLIQKKQNDESLPKRSISALYSAYVEPAAGIDKQDGKYLQEIAPRLESIAKNEGSGGRIANDALDLLAEMGMPACLPPFVAFVQYPHSQEAFRYVGTQRGIRCGGADGIVPITTAMPTTVAYERGILNKYLWREILALPAQKVVAERARSLLDSESWVARVTGVELLGALALKSTAKADAALVAKLKGDGMRLRGWWGKDGKKGDPTLGQVASKVAAKLSVAAEAK